MLTIYGPILLTYGLLLIDYRLTLLILENVIHL